ncbi:hypothetical protein AB6A23_06395 [Paenibacillus tarimensis]
MRGYYRLLNHEFSSMLRAVVFLCVGTIVSPLLFLNAAMKGYDRYSVHQRFEDIYASSGCIIVFLIYFAALCVFFLKSIYANYWGSKSIYTYLTLPVKREAVYFSKLSAFSVCMMMLLASQLVSVMLGYSLVTAKVASIHEGEYVMNNGLFLAFIRSDFLRLLLPLSFSGLLSTVSIGIALITGVYYGALCERSKRYWGFIFIVAALAVMINVLGKRTEQSFYTPGNHLYLASAALLVLSGFFVWHSIRLMKKGAIA